MTNGQIITTGGVGAGFSFGAWYLSHSAAINAGLQTASLIVGIVVGVLSIRKLLKKGKK